MKTLAMVAVLTFALMATPLTAQAGEDGKAITVQFEDRDLRDAIAMLAEAGGLNVIVSPKVEGRITLSLTDVPVRAALRMITESMGYVLVEEEYGILRVIPKAEAEAGADHAQRAARQLVRSLAQAREALETRRREDAEKLAKQRETLATLEQARAKALRLRAKLTAENAELVGKVAAGLGAYERLHAGPTRARGKAGEAVVQIHDVADLLKTHPELLLRARTVLPDAEVRIHGQTLVVKAAPEGQERLARVLGDLRGAHEGAGDLRPLRLAAARLEEAKRLVAALKATPKADEARNASKRLLELRVFQEHIQKQIAERSGKGLADEHRAAIRRLDEGTGRLLEHLHGLASPDGFDKVTVNGKVVYLPRVPEGLVVGKDGRVVPGGIANPDQPGVTVFRLRDGTDIRVLGADGKPVHGAVLGAKDAEGRRRIQFVVPQEGGAEAAAHKGVVWLKAKAGEDGPVHVQVERRMATATKTVHKEATWENLAALKQRIERLEHAAKLLQESGLPKEAESARRAAREALERLQQHAHAQPGHGGEALEAMNALRREVKALRGEVRELTHLVRKLLGDRR